LTVNLQTIRVQECTYSNSAPPRVSSDWVEFLAKMPGFRRFPGPKWIFRSKTALSGSESLN
jgi:hypothetical protein